VLQLPATLRQHTPKLSHTDTIRKIARRIGRRPLESHRAGWSSRLVVMINRGAGQCIAQRKETMTNNSLAGIAVLMVANGLIGCSNPAPPAPSAPSPSAPPVVSQPNPGPLVVFTDPVTGLSTSDVRDARDHVVQFTTANELIWIDGTHLPGHQVDGPGHRVQSSAPEPSCQCWLVVRFGATNGERRAYMTADVGHSNPGTVVDLEIAGSALVVSWTDLFPPGTFTLSGYVTEATATGLVSIENAEVWRLNEEQGGWDHNPTDKNGFYQLHGLSDGSRAATFSKEGYQKIDLRDVPVHGDTRFDVQLLRR
jgi:hypothetical protein